MWKPRLFLRNLCAFGFVTLVLFMPLLTLVGPVAALAVLFLVPVAAASFSEGVEYSRASGRVPGPHAVRSAARGMAEVYLSVLVIVTAVLSLSVPDLRWWLAHGNVIAIAAVYGSTTFVAFIAIRWSYALGAALAQEQESGKTR